MAMANMNLIGVFVTKLWPVQALACGGGDGGDGGDGGGDGGATKTIISPKFSNFGDIITELGTFLVAGYCQRKQTQSQQIPLSSRFTGHIKNS